VIVDSSQNYTFTGGGAIGGAGALTKSGTGKLTLSNTSANTYSGGTNVLGGTLEVSNNSSIGAGPLTVGGGTFRLLSGRTNAVHVDTVDVAGTGAVDLTDATLVIDDSPGSSLNDIRQAIESGYAGGAWTGPGIRSSLANANQYGVGYQDDGSTITLKRARFGDANLSGNVNSDDFNLLASSFGTSGKFWQNGDFNYSGVVNSDDFNLLAGNFGLSAGADGIVDPEDWAALAAAVPEPTACVIFGGIATSLGMFRRRGH
jgi:autotransporter-associated beta strand protein